KRNDAGEWSAWPATPHDFLKIGETVLDNNTSLEEVRDVGRIRHGRDSCSDSSRNGERFEGREGMREIPTSLREEHGRSDRMECRSPYRGGPRTPDLPPDRSGQQGFVFSALEDLILELDIEVADSGLTRLAVGRQMDDVPFEHQAEVLGDTLGI